LLSNKNQPATLTIFLLLGLTLLACAAPASSQPILESFPDVEQTGTIVDPRIQEASGLAASRINPDTLWIINDSGNLPILYAISFSGQLIQSCIISEASNRDWEDLAVFSRDGQSYLLIADVGDNRARRRECSLLIVREPALAETADQSSATLPIEQRIHFQYADGPRDCEAVAVDIQNKRILLVSKRTEPPELYTLPLPDRNSQDALTAQKVAAIPTIPPLTKRDLAWKYGQYIAQPTAMDCSPDGRRLTVLTYKHAYGYSREADQTWQQALNRAPERIELPHPDTGLLQQREALACDPHTGDLFVTSEGLPAPILRVQNVLKGRN
jgi:hypothetical protein